MTKIRNSNDGGCGHSELSRPLQAMSRKRLSQAKNQARRKEILAHFPPKKWVKCPLTFSSNTHIVYEVFRQKTVSVENLIT
jgi:hypothetical protein